MINVTVNSQLKQNTIIGLFALLLAYLLVSHSPLLFVFAIGAIVSAFLIFQYPESFFGLWMGGMFNPLFYFYPFLGSLRGWSYIPLIGVAFYVLKTKKRLFPVLNPMIILQFVFLALLSLGILWTPDKSYGITKTHHFLSLNIVSFISVFYFLNDTEKLKKLAYSIAIGGIFMTLSGYYFLHIGAFEKGWLGAFTAGSISYGRIAGASAIFIIGYLCFGRLNTFKKSLAITLMLLLLLASILCGQRGVLIALVIGIFVLFFSRLNFKNKRSIVKIFVWFFLAIASLTLLFHYLPEERIWRYTQMWQNPTEDPGFKARIELFRRGMELFSTSPIIGIGTGGYRKLGIGNIWIHNIFLETMVEWGIIGLTIFCLFIFLTSKYALKVIRNSEIPASIRNLIAILFSCFVFYLAAAQVSSNIIGNTPIWLFSGLICAFYFGLIRNKKEKVS